MPFGVFDYLRINFVETVMFKIKFLPARFGDAIWIEYGTGSVTHRVLIDGGTGGTRTHIRDELDALAAEQRRLDLVVVTHVDRDHIEGILKLLSEEVPGIQIDDFWFNGSPHLPGNPEDETFGPVQGERLTEQIVRLNLPWNKAFGGKAVVAPSDGILPTRVLAGGLKLTLLTPSLDSLARLKPKWEDEVRAANLDPGFGLESNDEETEEDEEFGAEDVPNVDELAGSQFKDDRSEANGSSIAMLAEFDGNRVLFAADASVGMLLPALERLSPGAPVSLNLFKISHHGSKNTTSRALIQKVDCPTYVFSTNGSNFKHPHAEAVARVITAGGDGPELIFNYRSDRNSIWDLEILKTQHGYETTYPEAGKRASKYSYRANHQVSYTKDPFLGSWLLRRSSTPVPYSMWAAPVAVTWIMGAFCSPCPVFPAGVRGSKERVRRERAELFASMHPIAKLLIAGTREADFKAQMPMAQFQEAESDVSVGPRRYRNENSAYDFLDERLLAVRSREITEKKHIDLRAEISGAFGTTDQVAVPQHLAEEGAKELLRWHSADADLEIEIATLGPREGKTDFNAALIRRSEATTLQTRKAQAANR
jgi:hypothetical protein